MNEGNFWDILDFAESDAPLLMGQDPDEVEVFCTREVWENHILRHHPEMKALQDLVLAAIIAPDDVEPDPEDKRVRRYYKIIPAERRLSHRATWIRVVVKYVYPPERGGRRSGLLSSAYLVRR